MKTDVFTGLLVGDENGSAGVAGFPVVASGAFEDAEGCGADSDDTATSGLSRFEMRLSILELS